MVGILTPYLSVSNSPGFSSPPPIGHHFDWCIMSESPGSTYHPPLGIPLTGAVCQNPQDLQILHPSRYHFDWSSMSESLWFANPPPPRHHFDWCSMRESPGFTNPPPPRHHFDWCIMSESPGFLNPPPPEVSLWLVQYVRWWNIQVYQRNYKQLYVGVACSFLLDIFICHQLATLPVMQGSLI